LGSYDANEPGGSLDVSFDVFRTAKPEPNTCELEVFNLNPNNRLALEEEGKKIAISVEAGYKDQTALLFLGVARTIFTQREGADLITTLQSGDGEKEYQQSRINISIAAGATNKQALDAVIKALGLGEGNTAQLAGQLAATKPLFPQGTVLTGSAAQVLYWLTSSLGFEFSIQDGALQVLSIGEPLAGTATKLTPDTGLIGSPSIDNEGVITAQALLIPEIFPGRLLTVESEFLSGNFRVETCRYTGSTFDNAWYVDIEGQKL
jgi:hypothetical protein